MIPDERLLAFHKRSRDAIRAVLAELDEEVLHRQDAVRGYSIAEEVGHLVAAEHWFLADELKLEPGFPYMNKTLGQAASCGEIRDVLERIEASWPPRLRAHPALRALRVVLARMALHTLYHLARIVDLRVRMNPAFRLPPWSDPGSWEHAIEPLLAWIGEEEA